MRVVLREDYLQWWIFVFMVCHISTDSVELNFNWAMWYVILRLVWNIKYSFTRIYIRVYIKF